MDFKVPFSGRAHSYTDEEIDIVVKVMRNANPLTQGRYLKEFEKKFCDFLRVEDGHCFAVNNATAGLELIAQLCQFNDGDEVIAPAHTFTASVYPFIKKGAKIVWADIDIDTKVVTAETIENVITDKTKAIIVVHLYGYTADMPSILEIAKKYNLIVIEDAAQSIGTELNVKKSGSFGDYAVFSFHSHKNITTLGEGGMLYVKDEKLINIIPLLRHNGHCAFPFNKDKYWVPAMGNVDLPEINGRYLLPNNFCIGEVECALGIKLLDRVDTINNEKRKRALYFIDSLKDYPELKFHRVSDKRHNYHLLVAQMMEEGWRDKFIEKMAFEKKVQCIVQYYPLYRYPFYKKLGYGKAYCPNTDKFYDNMISFPFHQWLSDEEIEYMIASTKEVLDDLRKERNG